MNTPEEIKVVIDDLERWKSVRERIKELHPKKRIENGSLVNAIKMLRHYRTVAWSEARKEKAK